MIQRRTDDHHGEVGTMLGDDFVPLLARNGEGRDMRGLTSNTLAVMHEYEPG